MLPVATRVQVVAPTERDHSPTSRPPTGSRSTVPVTSPVKVTGSLMAAVRAVVVTVTAVSAAAGSVGPAGTGALVPPVVRARAASWAEVPKNRFLSTLPAMPLTRPLEVYCQKV